MVAKVTMAMTEALVMETPCTCYLVPGRSQEVCQDHVHGSWPNRRGARAHNRAASRRRMRTFHGAALHRLRRSCVQHSCSAAPYLLSSEPVTPRRWTKSFPAENHLEPLRGLHHSFRQTAAPWFTKGGAIGPDFAV